MAAKEIAHKDNSHGSLTTYVIGFILSVALTLTAYFAVSHHVFGRTAVIAIIFVLAAVQLMVQLMFFLHLGREGKPRLNLMTFLFMLLVLVIVVGGTLWIMNNLNYHMMSPKEIQDMQGGGF